MEKKKLFLYGAACCILLGLIMALLDTFTATVSVMGHTVSESGGMEEDYAVYKILIIILDLAAIAALLLPAFGILADKAALLRLFAIGAAVLSAVLCLICLFVLKGDAKDAFGEVSSVGGSYGVHLSFIGWLLMIFHLGGAALAFLSSKEQ